MGDVTDVGQRDHASFDHPLYLDGLGAILAGACVLAAPVVVLFLFGQRYFISADLGSSVKG